MKKNPVLKQIDSASLEHVPVSIALHDTQNNIVWANKCYRESTGLSLHEIEGRKCYVAWGLEKACRNCPAKKAIENGGACEAELTPQNQDHWPESQGSWLAKATPVRNEQGDIIGAIEVAYDITERKLAQDSLKNAFADLEKQVAERTAGLKKANDQLKNEVAERKQAEAKLKKSEERYRELVENANSIILRMDPEGTVTFFNEFAQRFFGFSEDEIVGRNTVGTIVPETEMTGRDLTAMIRDIGKNPDRYSNNENENMRKSGERVWVAWTNRGVLDQKGHLSEILCIGNDITKRKKAEEALQQSKDKLQLILDSLPDMVTQVDRRKERKGVRSALDSYAVWFRCSLPVFEAACFS